MAWESTWVDGFKKIALNIPPFDDGSFNANDSAYTNQVLFVRESGTTESDSGSSTGYIYLNGTKYGDGLDTYINNVTYINGNDESHPYSLEFNYVDGSKDTFYVKIDDIETVYQQIDELSGSINNLSSMTISLSGDIYNDINYISSQTVNNFTILSGYIGDIDSAHTIIEQEIINQLDKTIVSATYIPYTSESGAILQLITYNGDIHNINVEDIAFIIENYQQSYDSGLTTNDKTITGAINELNVKYDAVIENVSIISGDLVQTNIRLENAYNYINEVNSALTQKIEYLEGILGQSYIDMRYENNILTLFRMNGDVSSVYIRQAREEPESGGCLHCCPIVDVANRVTDLELYIETHSGDSKCRDLEKRVATLENQTDLDDNRIIDFTTDPIRIDVLNQTIKEVRMAYRENGFKDVEYLINGETKYLLPCADFSMSGFQTFSMYADTDGDMTMDELGITEDNFLLAYLTKVNGSEVNVSDLNSLQTYLEEFSETLTRVRVKLVDGDEIIIRDAKSLFGRTKSFKTGLKGFGVTEDNFKSAVDGVRNFSDFDAFAMYVVSHLHELAINDTTLSIMTDISESEIMK